MVTISPTLEDKIHRRARRAFSRFDEGTPPRLHRITNLSKDRLSYRIPRSGKKRVEVVRLGREIVVDPPTTGLIDLALNADLKKLKNSTGKLHAGEITAYMVTEKDKKVGKTYKTAEKLYSRADLLVKVEREHHAYAVVFDGADVKDVAWDHVKACNYKISAELDLVKDFKFTDGLIDCLTDDDVKKLKKHVGQIRAYMHVKAKTTFQLTTYMVTSEALMSLDKAAEAFKDGDHIYAVEVDYDDVNLDKSGLSEFVARCDWEIVEELDLAAIGFTTGLYDCRTRADVEKLRKRRHLGRVRAYKYVTADLKSPTQTSTAIQYAVGKEVKVKNANTSDATECAAGINLGSVDWCQEFSNDKHRGLAFEFEMEDIAALPTDGGKFRVHRCDCVEEVDVKKFEPLKRAVESGGKQTKKGKKKGLFDKLLGRGDDVE